MVPEDHTHDEADSTDTLSFKRFAADLSRRGFIRGSAAAGVGLAGLGTVGAGSVAADENEGSDGGEMEMMSLPELLNYALTLERLEATYYEKAVGDDGAWNEWMVERSDVAAQFDEPTLRYSTYQTFADVLEHESYHVTLLEKTLDKLGAEVTAPSKFTFPDPVFEDLETFIKFAHVVEDLGVSAYAGAAPMLAVAELEHVGGDPSKLEITPAALGIHSIEARHAGYFRLLNEKRPWISTESTADESVDDPRTPEEVTKIASQYIQD